MITAFLLILENISLCCKKSIQYNKIQYNKTSNESRNMYTVYLYHLCYNQTYKASGWTSEDDGPEGQAVHVSNVADIWRPLDPLAPSQM